MAIATRTALTPVPGTVTCPSCPTETFSCEACLHHHLSAVHGRRYSEVFGHLPPAWPELCDRHRDQGTTMLGH